MISGISTKHYVWQLSYFQIRKPKNTWGGVGNTRFLLHNEIDAGPGIEAMENIKSIDRGSIQYLFGFNPATLSGRNPGS
jgi:hypothetical protein